MAQLAIHGGTPAVTKKLGVAWPQWDDNERTLLLARSMAVVAIVTRVARRPTSGARAAIAFVLWLAVAGFAVTLARFADCDSVDGDGAAVSADHLSGKRENALQHRHTAREIAAVGQERRKRLGRQDSNKFGNEQFVS